MRVIFSYKRSKQNVIKEKVITDLIKMVSEHLKLPDHINVEFLNLHDSCYAETVLEQRTHNLIRINSNLAVNELIKPIVHELIHLHQIHTNQLSVYRDGSINWSGSRYPVPDPTVLKYEDYKKLPWEMDVDQMLPKLLEAIFKKY
jgi:hypothetical protein